jgi:NAD-dependent SIR2 family protein deacetylase
MIFSANESWDRPIVAATSMAPDADAELTQDQINGFSIVPCPKCGGIIKPDVTFFGDNVNVNLVKHCYNKGKFEGVIFPSQARNIQIA